MLTYDYLVRRADSKKWHFSKDAISAEDAVNSVAGENVLYEGGGVGTYFFKGLNSGIKYVAYKVNYVYIVSTGECEDYAVVATKSTKEEAQKFMNQFPDEKCFNPIEERIIDDPRDDDLKVPEGEKIYHMRLKQGSFELIIILKRVKDVWWTRNVGKCGLMDHIFSVTVSAKTELEAIQKGKDLCCALLEERKNERT